LIRIIAIVFVLGVAAVLIVAASRPDSIRIQRSIVVSAPPQVVFPLINDFHNWNRWAPQDRRDPTMKRTFSGAISGVGAISDWQGSGETGSGRMTITGSVAPSQVTVVTDFERPFRAHNTNQFVLEPAGSSTTVTWTMEGQNLYLMKLMGLFVNMDRTMGKHFEEGLRNLKSAAESAPAQ
jgi:carbon monoxide dehydrogenase subunit G